MVSKKEEIGMICWHCGHLAKDHADKIAPSGQVYGCRSCFRFRSNKSDFFKHLFEDNLMFIERKAKEQKLV